LQLAVVGLSAGNLSLAACAGSCANDCRTGGPARREARRPPSMDARAAIYQHGPGARIGSASATESAPATGKIGAGSHLLTVYRRKISYMLNGATVAVPGMTACCGGRGESRLAMRPGSAQSPLLTDGGR